MVAAAAAVALVGCESVPVLLYHQIAADDDPARLVSAALLDTHLQILEEDGFTPITVSQLEAIELDGAPAPPKPVVITFDDGLLDFYQNAYPVLRRRGVPATMFLISGRIGEDAATRVTEPQPHLVWPEILEMQAAGIEMQSHTVRHVRLTDIPLAAATAELVDSKAALEARLGHRVTSLAFPFGVSDGALRGAAEEAGYRSAFSVVAGLDSRFGRLRTSIFRSTDAAGFRARLEGTWWGASSGARR